jgi:adenine deaminase
MPINRHAASPDFIAGLPKVELHVHIEGTLEPELCFELAARNGVALAYPSVDELRAAYRFGSLQDFLDIYYLGANVLVEEQDFYDLTWAYLKKSHGQNVVHAEIFFDPQTHTGRGIPFERAVGGIGRALDRAEAEWGMTSELIFCILRHVDVRDGLETVARACDHKDRLIGIGLDSSELGFPPSMFREIFDEARNQGFRAVAHAGEEGPPEYVTEALDILKIDRLDHGNRSLEDAALVERLVAEKIGLTVCPLSNLRLGGVDRMENHPLKRMLDKGLRATVNSDDPAYFGGYMNENLLAVTTALDLTETHLATLGHNAIQASFIDDDAKRLLSNQLDRYTGSAD